MKVKRALIAAACGSSIPCVIAWLHGYDFNERGPHAVTTFIMALVIGGAAAALSQLDWSSL